jgi:hypothetical protein
MPSILDGDDRAELERLGRLLERIAQTLDDPIHARLPEPKDDDARRRFDAQANELAEIEVERKQNSIFRGGFANTSVSGRRCIPCSRRSATS